jgi:leishmanolysin-like peptidase
MRSLLPLLLLLPAASHVCVHDAYSSSLEPAVKAPPTDGAGARRNAAASVAPIRITAIYAASNGGTDIATEVGMSQSLKEVLTTAVSAALARFSELLRVRPVSGPLFAYRECISQWSTNSRCSAVDTAPKCSGRSDDVVISLGGMLGSQVYYPRSDNSPQTLLPTGAGMPSTDTVIFVTAKQTSNCGSGGSGTLAYASYCQRASDDRPTFGRINFCPRMLPPSITDAGFEDLLSTALHELTHVLAFSSALFPYFRDDSGVERTPRDSWGDPADAFYSSSKRMYISSGSTVSYANERGMDCSWGTATSWATANVPYGLNANKAPTSCVARLSMPRVKAATRAFFNCDLLEGAELENQDTSIGFVQGSHWEARTLAGEYMAAYSFPGAKISFITLAVFEDSGWYTAAYSNSDKWVKGKDWGYQQGCAFARDKCSATNTGSPPHFYLGSPDVAGSLCSVDRSAPAYTTTKAYTTSLPSKYQYFSSPSKGGLDAIYDYCPAVTAYSSSLSCKSTGTVASIRYGEVVGAGSKCHISTLNNYGSSPSASSGSCYRVSCAGNGLSYTLTAKSGATATCTSDGSVASFSGYGGSVVCGDPAALCSAGEAWVPPCAAGFGLDAAISACNACLYGQYSGGTGTSCTSCSAGYYGSNTGLTAATCSGLLTCGYYGGAGAITAMGTGACAAGTYGLATSLRTSATCDGLCSAGYWCGAGSCSATQNACPAGTFGSTTGLTTAACTAQCPAGRYGASTAMTASTCTGECSAGHWCGAGSISPTQNACSPGTYSAFTGQTSAAACLPCANGTDSGYGATSCWQSTLTATASPTPTLTPSGTRSPSNTPLVTPSPGSAVLRLSLVFLGSSGVFTAAMQGTIITSTAAALGVPRASIGWLGVTNPSTPGISRLLQAGARVLQAGARVQLSLLPAAAASSPVIQASMASGSSLFTAVTSALSTGFNAALASQPDAAPLATALGYDTTAAMLASLSLDSSIPIAAVVMSATPSPSPRYGTTLSAAETGGLVGGILGGSALALYFITITIVACCVRCACCCQHAQCQERYRTRSIWCCCCTVTPPPPSKDAAAPGMVMRSAAV